MKKRFAFAVVLLLAAVLTVGVSAANDMPVLAEPVSVEGMEVFPVTSGLYFVGASDEALALTPFFDGFASTGAEFRPEAAEPEIVLCTSSSYPHTLSAIALMLAAEPDSVIGVDVWGTNDSLLADWTALDLANAVDGGAYCIFAVEDAPAAYTFYKIRVHLYDGSSFALSEMALLQPESDDPDYRYVSDGEVEGGSAPALLPLKTAEEPAPALRDLMIRFGNRTAPVLQHLH